MYYLGKGVLLEKISVLLGEWSVAGKDKYCLGNGLWLEKISVLLGERGVNRKDKCIVWGKECGWK